MKQFMMIGAAGLVLGACAGGPVNVTADQCTGADWRAVGLEHGKTGQSTTAVNPAIRSCNEKGLSIDMDAYNAGRDEGLKLYCEPATLLEASVQGVGDPFSCDPMTTMQRSSFEKGNETRKAVQRYQALKAQYDQLTQQKAKINEEGNQRVQQLRNATETTSPTRAQLQDRIGHLQRQLRQVDESLAKADPQMKTEEQTYNAAVQSYEAYKSGLAR